MKILILMISFLLLQLSEKQGLFETISQILDNLDKSI